MPDRRHDDAIVAAILASRVDLARMAARERDQGVQDAWRLHAALGALAIALALGERRWAVSALVRVAWWAGRLRGRVRM